MEGMLYSCIGYDLQDPKRVIIRNTDSQDAYGNDLTLTISCCDSETIVYEAAFSYWGYCWNSHWWIADFTAFDQPGEYIICAKRDGKTVFAGKTIEIGYNILLRRTYKQVAIEQFERRAELARNHIGFKDCGSSLREANSHAEAVIGLCDYLSIDSESLSQEEAGRLRKQIMTGCDYLSILQKKAKSLNLPVGALVHEIPSSMDIILADVAQAVVAFAKAGNLLSDCEPDKSNEYLQNAIAAMDYLLTDPPIGEVGFNHWNHGAPESYQLPHQIMTSDLLTMLWGAFSLYCAGIHKYESTIFTLADEIMERQIPQEENEGGFYGHFYTFPDKKFSEKANYHHHACMDTGAVFPYYIEPFFAMLEKFTFQFEEEKEKWRKMIYNFAYGFFLPACKLNPFLLMPMGYFAGEGILNFCGPWHGTNVSIGYAAVLALRLEHLTYDQQFREIAVGNLQWIAGLNCGITRKSLSDGSCVRWAEEIGPNEVIAMSQIEGIGSRHVHVWSRIPGAVANGFCRNIQFQLTVKPTKANDEPMYYTDEDWIPHGSGFITALAMLRVQKSWSPSYWDLKNGNSAAGNIPSST